MRENKFYEFIDSLQCSKTKEEFIKKIENFIEHEMKMNNICNLNSIFSEQRQPKWREKFIKVMLEKILPEQNFKDFEVESNVADYDEYLRAGKIFKFRKICNYNLKLDLPLRSGGCFSGDIQND